MVPPGRGNFRKFAKGFLRKHGRSQDFFRGGEHFFKKFFKKFSKKFKKLSKKFKNCSNIFKNFLQNIAKNALF